MIELASTSQWDELHVRHRQRDLWLSTAFRDIDRSDLCADSLRELSELNDALTTLVASERRDVGGRLARLNRDSSACSAYRESAAMDPQAGT
jgi:hypothetical protein